MGVMNCIDSVDCLDEGFLTQKGSGQSVAMLPRVDDVATDRCRTLQHVARRLAAHGGTQRRLSR